MFRRDLTHFEVLHVHHAVDHVLRFFAEWVVRLILPQVGFQRFSIWMRFHLMNQLVDYYFACIVFLLNCREWLSLNSSNQFYEAYHPHSNRNRFPHAYKKRRRIVFRPNLMYPSSFVPSRFLYNLSR